ncbi:MAG: hypothetical protein GY753_11870 [Gammaproteobacteria bacterium]|nr:hypothetical protein [Gammaproteobacteria bacterium]
MTEKVKTRNSKSKALVPLLAMEFFHSPTRAVNISQFAERYGVGASTMSKFTSLSDLFANAGIHGLRFTGDADTPQDIEAVLYKCRDTYSQRLSQARAAALGDHLTAEASAPQKKEQMGSGLSAFVRDEFDKSQDYRQRAWQDLSSRVDNHNHMITTVHRQNARILCMLSKLCEEMGISIIDKDAQPVKPTQKKGVSRK